LKGRQLSILLYKKNYWWKSIGFLGGTLNLIGKEGNCS